MQRVSLSSSCSSHERERLSSVRKTTAVLKKAMIEKSDKWKSRRWVRDHENPGGSSRQEAAGNKAPMTRGSTRNQKVSGKKSLQNLTRLVQSGKKRKNT